MNRVFRLGQPVVGELPFLRDLDQFAAEEVSEVARDGGLRHPENLGDITDAELTGCQQIQDTNPGGVRESFKEIFEIDYGWGGRAGRHRLGSYPVMRI